MKKRTGPGTWRLAEGRAIEAEFEGEHCQIACMNRTRWSHPDQAKNTRFRATEDGDAKFIVLADHHFDAAVEALRIISAAIADGDGGSYWPARKFLDDRGIYHGDLNDERVLDAVARAVLAAIEKEIKDNDTRTN